MKNAQPIYAFILLSAIGSAACSGESETPSGTGGPGGGGSGGASQASGGSSGTGGTTRTETGAGGSSSTSTTAEGGATGTGGNARTGGAAGGAGAGSGGSRTGGSRTGGSGTDAGAGGLGGATSKDGGADASAAGAGLTLYYVRHAEVEANVLDPSQVTTENMDAFTELGQRQIAALTTYLKGLGIRPDAVLVSPAIRAQKTIEPYLVDQDIAGEIWMELHETSDKDSTGAPLPAEPKYYGFYKATIEAQNLAFRDPNATKFWQNDTYEAGLLMATTAKNELLARYSQSGKTILVVGHAMAGVLLLGLLGGDDMIDGPAMSGPNLVFILNTGVMRAVQDRNTGLFKVDGKNINNPATK